MVKGSLELPIRFGLVRFVTFLERSRPSPHFAEPTGSECVIRTIHSLSTPGPIGSESNPLSSEAGCPSQARVTSLGELSGSIEGVNRSVRTAGLSIPIAPRAASSIHRFSWALNPGNHQEPAPANARFLPGLLRSFLGGELIPHKA